MMDRIDDITDERLRVLREIEKDKLRVAKAYNKKVKQNYFKLEILCGRLSCRLDQKTISLVRAL